MMQSQSELEIQLEALTKQLEISHAWLVFMRSKKGLKPAIIKQVHEQLTKATEISKELLHLIEKER